MCGRLGNPDRANDRHRCGEARRPLSTHLRHWRLRSAFDPLRTLADELKPPHDETSDRGLVVCYCRPTEPDVFDRRWHGRDVTSAPRHGESRHNRAVRCCRCFFVRLRCVGSGAKAKSGSTEDPVRIFCFDVHRFCRCRRLGQRTTPLFMGLSAAGLSVRFPPIADIRSVAATTTRIEHKRIHKSRRRRTRWSSGHP